MRKSLRGYIHELVRSKVHFDSDRYITTCLNDEKYKQHSFYGMYAVYDLVEDQIAYNSPFELMFNDTLNRFCIALNNAHKIEEYLYLKQIYSYANA